MCFEMFDSCTWKNNNILLVTVLCVQMFFSSNSVLYYHEGFEAKDIATQLTSSILQAL